MMPGDATLRMGSQPAIHGAKSVARRITIAVAAVAGQALQRLATQRASLPAMTSTSQYIHEAWLERRIVYDAAVVVIRKDYCL